MASLPSHHLPTLQPGRTPHSSAPANTASQARHHRSSSPSTISIISSRHSAPPTPFLHRNTYISQTDPLVSSTSIPQNGFRRQARTPTHRGEETRTKDHRARRGRRIRGLPRRWYTYPVSPRYRSLELNRRGAWPQKKGKLTKTIRLARGPDRGRPGERRDEAPVGGKLG